MSSGNVPNFTAGMPKLPSEHLNSMLGSCQRADTLRQPPPTAQLGGFWTGILDATGETPYTDERYWVKIIKCTNAAGDEHTALTLAARTGSDPRTLQTTATNLAEAADGTHTLDSGTYVWGWWMPDAQGVVHRFFSQSSPQAVWTAMTERGVSHRTGTTYSGAYDWNDGTTQHTGYAYYAFEVDGDTGLSIAQNFAQDSSFYMSNNIVLSTNQTAGSPSLVHADIFIDWVTAQFDPTNVTFASPPSNWNFYGPFDMVATMDITGGASIGANNGVQIAFNDESPPANVHGVRIRPQLTTYPSPKNGLVEFTSGGANPPGMDWAPVNNG